MNRKYHEGGIYVVIFLLFKVVDYDRDERVIENWTFLCTEQFVIGENSTAESISTLTIF